MFYLIISIIINFFLIYFIYKKILSKINEPEKKHLSEINSLIIEFNKITKNNIDLLEEKIYEIKNLLKLVDKKFQDLKNFNNQKQFLNKTSIDNAVTFNQKNKSNIIKDLLKEGKSDKEIAKIMGISKAEVELYINLAGKQ